MPHRRGLRMHGTEMLADLGPDRALRGAARVRPNREASRQCGRRIDVSSRASVLDFLGLSLSLLSSSSCRAEFCAALRLKQLSLQSWDFSVSLGFLVSWVLIFGFACKLRPVVTGQCSTMPSLPSQYPPP
jgi:hypothetical protein